jgi:hypothetical protein
MPWWRPSWRITAARVWSPPTKACIAVGPAWPGTDSISTGSSRLTITVSRRDGSPRWIPAGTPSIR